MKASDLLVKCLENEGVDCGITGFMKTLENKVLMRICRKDLTMPKQFLIVKCMRLRVFCFEAGLNRVYP